ncbi:MAG: hypothetical protein ABEL76_03025, partial [Bradymonadaceae bacterium]
VYYHVTSTETHYFLAYLLYYPARSTGGSSSTEHHFAGGIFVVDRNSGKLVLVDGVKLVDGGPDWRSFTPTSSNITSNVQFTSLDQVPASDWKLEDGTHYPMYVKKGVHETCYWFAAGTGGFGSKCGHAKGQFSAGPSHGAILRPGDSAQTWSDGSETQSGSRKLTYELVPFFEPFWTARTSLGPNRLFTGTVSYTPNEAGASRPSSYPGYSDHRLPRAMASDDPDSVGETPMAWISFSTGGGRGQWLLDPAYVVSHRFEFPGDVSTKYCYNAFFGIDARGSTSAPNCDSSSGSGPDGGSTPDAGGAG